MSPDDNFSADFPFTYHSPCLKTTLAMSRQSSLSFNPPEAIKQVLTSVTAMSTAQLVAASSFGTGNDKLPLSHADNVLIAFSSLYPVIHRDVKLLICMDGEQRAEFRNTFGISFDLECVSRLRYQKSQLTSDLTHSISHYPSAIAHCPKASNRVSLDSCQSAQMVRYPQPKSRRCQ